MPGASWIYFLGQFVLLMPLIKNAYRTSVVPYQANSHALPPCLKKMHRKRRFAIFFMLLPGRQTGCIV